MLGDKLGELRGKVAVNRVLPGEGEGPKVETTFQDGGTILGVEVKNMGTYWAVVRPDGSLYGEGQGVTMGKNGEMATWKGQGVGQFGKGGAVTYRGALYYSSQFAGWTRLNKVAALFHWSVDGDGNTHAEFHEWK